MIARFSISPARLMVCGLFVFLIAAAFPLLAADKSPVDAVGFRELITPFLKSHCQRCHGAEKQEGEFRVDKQLLNDFSQLTVQEKWREVVNMLNSHEMPPEKEPQPQPDEVGKVVDWITAQMQLAELSRREGAIVLRRMNREEYRNTIRDLVGIDFDPVGFPQDPPAGGFDNNGQALTVSPLLLELYLEAARKIFDRALVEGEQPPVIRWRMEFETGDSDSNRVPYAKQNLIVNGGKNRVAADFSATPLSGATSTEFPTSIASGVKILHHDSWDRHLNTRDFRLPHAGDYTIRVRAAGRVPSRKEVVASADLALADRLEKQMKENAKGEKWHKEAYTRDLKHFETDRMYDYGPPRFKLIQDLGGQPHTLLERDVDAPLSEPRIYEHQARFTTEGAGLTIEYAYAIPKVLENFWFQGHDVFARPELWVDWLEIEGPQYPSWPPPSQLRVLGDPAKMPKEEKEFARQVIAKFMRRAYRRPVTNDEVTEKFKLFELVRGDSPSAIQALKTPLIAILCSPHFLYLSEATPASRTTATAELKASRKLTDHEFATRLSYFLWSSMPDEELFRLADAGTLRQPAVRQKQITRMLKDPKSAALAANFAGQWLSLREVGANPPAMDLYPQYDRHLETAMVDEAKAFFAEILNKKHSVMNFVKSDFLVINERLARYYGVEGVRGDEFRRVPVPADVHRGGIVTQAAFLTITSNGTRTSPVKRGVWVMKNVLGIDPGLPVANAGDIAPKVPGLDKATVRKRLEIHRTLPQCARCHNKIDPLGFALENFNAAGEWRDREGFGYKGRIDQNDPLIDAASQLPDGTAIDGVDSLRDALLAKEELFLKCLAAKLWTYALGRECSLTDQPQIQAAVKHLQKNQYALPALIEFIVASEAFGTK